MVWFLIHNTKKATRHEAIGHKKRVKVKRRQIFTKQPYEGNCLFVNAF